MTKEEFKKLQVGDLVEWRKIKKKKRRNNINKLGIVMATTNFKTTMCGNGTTQDTSYYQVRVKWNDYEYTSVYTEDDESSIELITLIAEAKK